jgi:hypothetical protein
VKPDKSGKSQLYLRQLLNHQRSRQRNRFFKLRGIFSAGLRAIGFASAAAAADFGDGANEFSGMDAFGLAFICDRQIKKDFSVGAST